MALGDFQQLKRIADAAERIADALEALQLRMPVNRDENLEARAEAERADARLLLGRERRRSR